MSTKPNNIGVIYLALLGALIATLCDKAHVLTNTLYYPSPDYWDQPWWSFPGFFVAFVAMGFSYLFLVKKLPDSEERTYSVRSGNYTDLINSLLLFAFVYLMSGFGNDFPILLNVIFYGTFLLRMAITKDKQFMLILSILMGISGAFVEGTLTVFDLVYYTKPVVYHVPLWLAALYLHGAFALRDGMRLFVYREK